MQRYARPLKLVMKLASKPSRKLKVLLLANTPIVKGKAPEVIQSVELNHRKESVELLGYGQ
jgi:hypothetical protein